jgi:AcrR family transcriptional regulator
VPAADPPPGRRERKKMQTRYAIRREAFRLFEQNGYADTTIDQIANAAEVSPRTFYRYFGVKEAVLISDDQISPIVAAFVAAPGELTLVAAYRHAVAKVFGALSQEQRDDAIAGQQMMYGIPEARGLLYTEYVRLIGLVAQAIEARLEEPTDEVERRVLAGAIVGVLIAASHDNPLPEDALLQSLSILDARLR